jgi:hypothetical protein
MYNVINGDVTYSMISLLVVLEHLLTERQRNMQKQHATFYYYGLMFMQLQTYLGLIGFVLTEARFAG